MKSAGLYNVIGQLISINNSAHINLSKDPKGMYFIKIITRENKIYIKKNQKLTVGSTL
jgi:hypothetical protein